MFPVVEHKSDWSFTDIVPNIEAIGQWGISTIIGRKLDFLKDKPRVARDAEAFAIWARIRIAESTITTTTLAIARGAEAIAIIARIAEIRITTETAAFAARRINASARFRAGVAGCAFSA
jgi:hypothetical protein